jgi:hypothetical protein
MNAKLSGVVSRKYPLSIVIGMQNQMAHELEKEPCNLSKIILGTMSPLAFFLNFLINNVTTLNE